MRRLIAVMILLCSSVGAQVDSIEAVHRDCYDDQPASCPKGYRVDTISDGGYAIDVIGWRFCYRCVKDTTADSVYDIEPLNEPNDGDVKVWNGRRWEWRQPYPSLDSSEIATLREMIKAWKAGKILRSDEPIKNWLIEYRSDRLLDSLMGVR